MLGTALDGKTPTFVAIDNRALAPSMKELAWELNYPPTGKLKGKETPPLDVTVDGKEWVNRLVHGRQTLVKSGGSGGTMDKSVGILAETGGDCCDLDVALQYGTQSSLIVTELRRQVHKLLFTDMKGLAEAVDFSRVTPPLGVEFPRYDDAGVTPRKTTPSADKDQDWAFTIAAVSDKGTVSYYAFKIDWAVVAGNIRNGMKAEMAELASMFPGSNGTPALDPGAFEASDLMKLRKEALGLSNLFPETVAPEALFVRHAYLALRQPNPADVDDAKAQKQIVDAYWKKGDTKATYKVVYVAGPEGAPLRRKP
jgi:hypothetical protein